MIVVFGAGGDRDREKRPLMGAVAARLADVVVITSDNPRSEEPATIAEEILAGVADDDRGRVEVQLDRAEAIRHAIALAEPGDMVIIAGKGHESTQTIGDQVIAFDDRIVARHVLEHAHERASLRASESSDMVFGTGAPAPDRTRRIA